MDSFVNTNTAEFYKAQFEAVRTKFEDGDTEDAFADDCVKLLEDPCLPVVYRVHCHFMYAHASNEPQYHIEQSLKALGTIEAMEESGVVDRTEWRIGFKTELENVLARMTTVSEGNDSSADDGEVAELPNPGLADTATIASSEQVTLTTKEHHDSGHRPSSPIIHPIVQQYEDDQEMLLGTYQAEGGFTMQESAVIAGASGKGKRRQSPAEDETEHSEEAPGKRWKKDE